MGLFSYMFIFDVVVFLLTRESLIQLQELKHRASGNVDEPFLSPGVSEKQPLHVVMVRSFEVVEQLTSYADFYYIRCKTRIDDLLPFFFSSFD